MKKLENWLIRIIVKAILKSRSIEDDVKKTSEWHSGLITLEEGIEKELEKLA